MRNDADDAMLRAKQEGKRRIGRIGRCQEPALFARRMLEIEITEGTAIVDVPSAASQLRELIDMGLGVALDDCGSAYSRR